MAKAFRFHRTGGPEVMQWEEVEVGAPGPGQVKLKATAIGLNYLDTYHRTGLYPMPLPSPIGMEGAGEVIAVGEGVKDFKPGDHVAYSSILGSYAEERLAPADKLVKVPAGVSDKVAAAIMLKGMTAEYLLNRTYKVKPGDTILFHAAAGGVGLIACQWAKHLGATVIGTVGSDEKAALAKAHGCDHVINYSRENFVERVKEITGGKGLPVVYDSVGKSTWPASLDCLQPLGMMVSFGNSSGPIPPVEGQLLSAKGSLFFTRPTLMTYVGRRDWLEASAAALFDVVAKGIVKIEINQTYALKDAVQAHIDLEARKTTGSTVLIP